MGFPIIMYLSKSKVGRFWDNRNKQKTLISGIKSKINFSLNPEFSIETEFKKRDKMEIPTIGEGSSWPPYQSLEIALSMEKQLRKNHKVGTMDDFINHRLIYPCYKLKGKLFLDKESNNLLHKDIKEHGINGILVLEGTNTKVSVYMAYENIAGITYRNEKWEVWESGALHFCRDIQSRGYNLIGLFTYEGESDTYFADCGILYFASMHGSDYYSNDEIRDTIYNEY